MIASLLLRAARAEVQTLRDQVDALRETPDGLRRLLTDNSLLIAHCRDYPAKARRSWDDVNKPPDGALQLLIDLDPVFALLLSLTETCRETIAAVRKALEEAELYREDWQAESLVPIPVADLAPLGAAIEELGALRSELSREWERLNAPPPPRTRPLLTAAEVQAALEAGESYGIEDIMAELKATSPETP